MPLFLFVDTIHELFQQFSHIIRTINLLSSDQHSKKTHIGIFLSEYFFSL